MSHDREHSHSHATTGAVADHERELDPGARSATAALAPPGRTRPSGLVQRAARDDRGVAAGADQAVAAASSSTGAALPSGLLRKFEASLGADLSGVRVHTGEASATAAHAVSAQAYALGQDIHFGAGRYDPSSAAGEQLIAHEVAHTVQHAGRLQTKLEVSSTGDALEHEADRAAEAMVAGRPAAIAGRSTQITRKPDADVGAKQDGTILSTADNAELLAPGDAGYSRQLLAATTAQAAAHAGTYAGARLAIVAPVFDPIDRAIAIRQAQSSKMKLEGGDSVAGTPGIAKHFLATAAWCDKHIARLEGDRSDELAWFTRFSAWVPRANSLFTSLARLEAMQEMLGATDPKAMAGALVKGLAEAKQVGVAAQGAWDKNKSTNPVPLPKLDASVTQASAKATQAGHKMATAHLGYQAKVTIAMQQAQVAASGAKAAERKDEIEAAIKFVGGVGKTIDSAFGVISAAPAKITNVTKGLDTMKGKLANADYLSGAGGTPMVAHPMEADFKDYATPTSQQDLSGIGKPGGELTLPTSVSGVLETLADVYFAGELRTLNVQLEQVKTRCGALTEVAEAKLAEQAAGAFQDSVNDFALAMRDWQKAVEARRQDYLELGVALDNFAKSNAKAAGAKGPAPGKEKFATILTVVSAVREVLAAGMGARSGFAHSAFLGWFQGFASSRSQQPAPGTTLGVAKLAVQDDEFAPIERVSSQVATYEGNVAGLVELFAPVEAGAAALFGALSQGAGGKGAGEF